MKPLQVGCCITPHGFGHAARAAAVMQALHRRLAVEFLVVTSVPPWFFPAELRPITTFYPLETDIGLVQHSSLEHDLEATLGALATIYPLRDALVEELAPLFRDCQWLLSDIAPLGIALARRAGIVSVLVENFTWDWIYGAYLESFPRLGPYIQLLGELYQQVDYRIQASPVCLEHPCALRVNPIARQFGDRGTAYRERFVPEGRKLVLITMGGHQGDALALGPLVAERDCFFLLPASNSQGQVHDNIGYFQPRSSLYHPDLVAAADVVIGKVGYSTMAEVLQAGVAYGYLTRPDFPESASMEAFIGQHIPSRLLSRQALVSGSWLEVLPELIASSGSLDGRLRADGADQVADFLLGLS